MTWVITRLCRDCVDQSCVEVCPIDCIYEYTGNARSHAPAPLFVLSRGATTGRLSTC